MRGSSCSKYAGARKDCVLDPPIIRTSGPKVETSGYTHWHEDPGGPQPLELDQKGEV